jgi:hypothetical protein
MTADEWVRQFAEKIGEEPPTPHQTGALLKLASIAAHASERTAAPIACWLAGRAGVDPAELHATAEAIGDADQEG